jgi:HAD superfamily hydrolase (TIGR01509 family)
MRNSPDTEEKTESIIFDMDATLLDTSPVWEKAETLLLESIGSSYSGELARLYKGMSPEDVGRTIYDQIKPDSLDREGCATRLKEFLMDCYKEPVEEMPGANDLIDRVAGNFNLAVASGSPREALKQVMGAHNWTMALAVLVSSEEVENGKPAPDVFLEAAQRLGTPPDKCLVIEDSLHGVKAAKAANMKRFVVPSMDDPQIAGTADRAFASLADITLEDIKGAARE